jgi:hypothetical protein
MIVGEILLVGLILWALILLIKHPKEVLATTLKYYLFVVTRELRYIVPILLIPILF